MQPTTIDEVRNVLAKLSTGVIDAPIDLPSVERAENEVLRGRVWFLQQDLERLHNIKADMLHIIGWCTFWLCTGVFVFGLVAGLTAGVPVKLIAATAILLAVSPIAQWAIIKLYFGPL